MKMQDDRAELALEPIVALVENTAIAEFEQLASQHSTKEYLVPHVHIVVKPVEQTVALAGLESPAETAEEDLIILLFFELSFTAPIDRTSRLTALGNNNAKELRILVDMEKYICYLHAGGLRITSHLTKTDPCRQLT